MLLSSRVVSSWKWVALTACLGNLGANAAAQDPPPSAVEAGPAGVAASQSEASASAEEEQEIPNECCDDPFAYCSTWDGEDPTLRDQGTGSTKVTLFGAVTRTVRIPMVHDSMSGLARLYQSTFKFDQSLTAWGESGGKLTQIGEINYDPLPVPSLLPADLFGGATALQPRPGTMPGMYLYHDATGDLYYQYGGPISSGASPSSTAVYGEETVVVQGFGPGQTTMRHSNLSGAQLWYYGGASPVYIEVKHVDGSVAKFESFNAWSSTSSNGPLWRLKKVNDPFDNTATYAYDDLNRLTSITFSSGLQETFNYAPSWGWSGGYSCLEVAYSQTSGSTPTQLPERTWGLAFLPARSTEGSHFGSRLYRTYSAPRKVLKEPASGSPYSITTSAVVTGQIVHTFAYTPSSLTATETQSVHTGTAFAPTLTTDSALPDRIVLTTTFNGTNKRVATIQDSILGAGRSFSYGSPTRSEDLENGVYLWATTVTSVVDSNVETTSFEFYPPAGRVYSIIHTPDGAYGRPRYAAASGSIGIASTDYEPTRIEIYKIFAGNCTCQRPSEVQVRSYLGDGLPSVRRTKFEYFSDTKLLSKRTVSDPATNPTQSGEISWQYTYVQAKTSGQLWGAWLPDQEITPDGTYQYIYDATLMANRADATNHGQMPGMTTRTISQVRVQNALTNGGSTTTTSISEAVYRNLSNSPGGYSMQGLVHGQPRGILDGDNVLTVIDYKLEGWVQAVSSQGGASSVTYGHDAGGRTTSVTNNSGSTGFSVTTSITDQSGLGDVYAASATVNCVPYETRQYFDRFGHLAVSRKFNKGSDGLAPTKHLGSTTTPREWVESQWVYAHDQLQYSLQDRLPLDLDGGTGQFLRTAYDYYPDGRLKKVTHPSGSTTEYTFDGYGTLFYSVTKDPSGAKSLTSAKSYVNPFLEVTGVLQDTGPDKLWTVIERNDAGTIVKITEPTATALPPGYTDSGGGAVHTFEVDSLGRVLSAVTSDGPGGTTLSRRETNYDQLGRRIWQHDLVLGFGSGDHHIAWRYENARVSQLHNVEQTEAGPTIYSYDLTTGLLTGQQDAAGNTVRYTYYQGTRFVQKVEREDQDPDPPPQTPPVTTRKTQTTYDVDGFGRVTAIYVGGSSALEHRYAYNSLGRVDRYTDPAGKLQKFLADALGRVVEHARLDGNGGYILNDAVYMDGDVNGRTSVTRHDGNSNATVEIADFAGRPYIVQNPGGSVEPTDTQKHQSMCLYAEYDGASRLTSVYDGDGGKTVYWRNGSGKVIQRELEVRGPQIAQWNTRDVFIRNAAGRLRQTNLWGSTQTGTVPDHGFPVGYEQFDQDSLGRAHSERFQFPLMFGNVINVKSTFSSGSGLRQGLEYLDGTTSQLAMTFDHDAIGRLTNIDWNGAASNLATYQWVGGLRRNRAVKFNAANTADGKTTYGYDDYDRLLGIKDEVKDSGGSGYAIKSQFDYVYDNASNLKREIYIKHDTSAGDRFAYDGYHRLTTAWMGVTQTTMADASDPSGWDPTKMHEMLTYGLDAVNNRSTSADRTSSGTVTTTYLMQAGNNRYDTVTVSGGLAVTQEYDERGNLKWDGRFYYRYDYLNRLQEVWKARTVVTDGDAVKYAVVQEGALEASKEEVELSIPDLMQRLPREHTDPAFRARLRAQIVGGVIRLVPTGGGGFMPMPIVPAYLDLVSVYSYDAFNRRIMSIVIDVDTEFHSWDGWRQVGQFVPDWGSYTAQATKQFVWGSRLDELMSYRRKVGTAWENYFILQGGQDTSAKLVDSNGFVVEEYEYDPYGKATVYTKWGSSWLATDQSQYGLPFLWKGIRLDSETGLLYMRNRYYSTVMGRFLTTDPLGVWGDQLNYGSEYAYCGDNGLMFGDPLGLQSSREGGQIRPWGERFHVNYHYIDKGGYLEVLSETELGEVKVVDVIRTVKRDPPKLVFEFSCSSMRFGWFWTTTVTEEETITSRFTAEHILETYKDMIRSLRKGTWLTDNYAADALSVAGGATVIHDVTQTMQVRDLTSVGRSMSASGSGFAGAAARWAGVVGVPVAIATVEEHILLKWAESKWQEAIEEVERVSRIYHKQEHVEWSVAFGCDLASAR